MKQGVQNYFGIDFGTTSCAVVGYIELDGKLEKIKYGDDESRPVPSVVAIDKTSGAVYTGREAWERKMELSESCYYISSVKTILAEEKTLHVADRDWSPVDVAAALFQSLRRLVAERTQLDMQEATVAIPIGFSASKRRKLRRAAQMAGLHISSFVSEPTAAFFANYEQLKDASIIAVFDWGGGTLDVSILKNENKLITELATAGANRAGDYIDKEIAHKMHAKISRKKGKKIDFADMPLNAQDMMLVRAERAKRELGDDDVATITINNYGSYGACRENIEYDWFAEIVRPEVDMAMACLKRAVEQAGLGMANIDSILMVGGSSNLGPLYDRMEAEGLADKLVFPEETMWNVGEGAAQLARTPGGYYASQSVDIILSDGSPFNLLPEGTPLQGYEKKCTFGVVDCSDEARFVFGGSKDIEEGSEKSRVLSLPKYGFLEEKLDVHAFVDENMLFTVSAKSNMRTEAFERFWEYPQLKCCYKLPTEEGCA